MALLPNSRMGLNQTEELTANWWESLLGPDRLPWDLTKLCHPQATLPTSISGVVKPATILLGKLSQPLDFLGCPICQAVAPTVPSACSSFPAQG